MEIKSFIYNNPFELCANTYLIIDDVNNCFVVDPGKKYNGIKDYLKENNLKPLGILLTHGHFDHISGIDILVSEFSIPVYIHPNDEKYLSFTNLNCSDRFSKMDFISNIKPHLIKEGDIIKGLSENIDIIETPFHTQGSVCFYLKDSKLLFSGDSLFKQGYGRTDLPGGNASQMKLSLKKIFSLPEDVKVYPGHGEETTIKDEKF